jgi:hypothetical protein
MFSIFLKQQCGIFFSFNFHFAVIWMMLHVKMTIRAKNLICRGWNWHSCCRFRGQDTRVLEISEIKWFQAEQANWSRIQILVPGSVSCYVVFALWFMWLENTMYDFFSLELWKKSKCMLWWWAADVTCILFYSSSRTINFQMSQTVPFKSCMSIVMPADYPPINKSKKGFPFCWTRSCIWSNLNRLEVWLFIHRQTHAPSALLWVFFRKYIASHADSSSNQTTAQRHGWLAPMRPTPAENGVWPVVAASRAK